jgi:hypothetical protein
VGSSTLREAASQSQHGARGHVRQKAPKIPKADDPITAEWARELVEFVIRNSIDVGQSSGLSMRQSPYGTSLAVIQPESTTGFLAVTSTAITANTLVTTGATWTPGSGSVFAVNFNGTHLEADTSEEFDVLNFSTTTGGIAIDVLVWVETDGTFTGSSPNYFITAVDCGNPT